MRAQEIATAPVITLTPRTPVKEAATLLVRHGITAAPVLDHERLVGIVTEADLLRGRVAPDPREHLGMDAGETAPLAHEVSELMTAPVHTCPAGADVADVIRMMGEEHIRAVPLVEGDHLMAMVTRRDILRLTTVDDAQLRSEIRTALAAEAGGWSVEVAEGAVHLAGGAGDPRVAEATVRTVPGVARVSVSPARGEQPRDHAGLAVLAFSECLRRIASSKVGRIAFADGGEIVMLPVNHALDGSTIVFRTGSGSKLFAADTAAEVAFEVDGWETVRRSGWSVLVKGRASRVYDDDVIARLDRFDLDSWADHVQRPVWVRITPVEVSGREVTR